MQQQSQGPKGRDEHLERRVIVNYPLSAIIIL